MKKEISSGAEKAEKLTKKGGAKSTSTKKPVKDTAENTVKKTKTVKEQKPAKKDKSVKSKKTAKKKNHVKMSEKWAKKRELRKEKKLEAMRIRAEKKQKRLEKKLEHKQKRLERIAAIKEAREARMSDAKRAKIQARQAKREALLAEKRAKREHRLKMRAQKRAEKNDRRHAPGFGGWLAAVIALGVTTLALGTLLTFGWINMNGMQSDMANVYTGSLYELNSVVDNLDTNLAKARVSTSGSEQVKILSDIAIQSEIAETILERMPVDTRLTQNMTSFVNKMGDSAQSMLLSVSRGNELTDSQIATIEHMYNTNLQLKEIINELTANADSQDMLKAMRGKTDNLLYSTFDDIENTTIETPKEIHDGPFAENIDKVNAKALEGLEEISAPRAEELAKEYFADYGVKDAKCTGETLAEQLSLYNVSLKTKDGEMFAQLSKQGGKVVEFNSYKDCSDKNFSVERCIDIAEDFLTSLGIEGMKAVWTSENGTTCNLNFAYVQDGVVIYSDMIKVKVCEERGIVTGMEGLAYVLNHSQRELPSARITKDEAKEKLHEGFEVEFSRLCVIPTDGGEVLAYEFCGTYEGNDYYIYIDAKTGSEAEVFRVIGTKQGRALM
ncbi:MAG: germination protein YpeB [Clostridiales bacterium]|nr:germination protein YpeB [Clostridiales bacterium]